MYVMYELTMLVPPHDSNQRGIFVLDGIPQAKSAVAGAGEYTGGPTEILSTVLRIEM